MLLKITFDTNNNQCFACLIKKIKILCRQIQIFESVIISSEL
jgi:hypothetical protein